MPPFSIRRWMSTPLLSLALAAAPLWALHTAHAAGAGLMAAPYAAKGWNWAFGVPGAGTAPASRIGANGRLAGPV